MDVLDILMGKDAVILKDVVCVGACGFHDTTADAWKSTADGCGDVGRELVDAFGGFFGDDQRVATA